MADIYSEISDVQREISEFQRMIKELQAELRLITNACVSATGLLIGTGDRIRNSMEANNQALNFAEDRIKLTLQTQLQIKELFYIFKDIETANKKIRMFNNKLYFEFKNQSKVRKVVRGFLDNVDLDLINDEKLEKIIEKSHLQTPDFWLTFVLLALVAWKNNDKAKCKRCVESAIKLNEKATTLFMLLFNLKVKRISAAVNWLENYKKMEKVGLDENVYLMLISSIPTKINQRDELREDDFACRIIDFIKDEVNASQENVNVSEYVEIVVKFFNSLDSVEAFQYESVSKYVKDYQNLAKALSAAQNNAAILQYLEETAHVLKRERNEIINNYIDQLISIPSNGESDIKKEIEYNEEIIRTIKLVKQGDDVITSSNFKQIAKENYDKKVLHDDGKLNLCNELMNWCFINRKPTINTLTYWNIFMLNKPYVEKGYKEYRQRYLDLNSKEQVVTINDFEITTDFSNIDRDIKLKNEFIENKRKILLKKARKTICIIFLILTILGMGGVIATSVLKTEKNITILLAVLSAIFFVISIGGLILSIVRKKQINERMDKESARLEKTLSELYEDKNKYDDDFSKADEISKEVVDFLKRF